VLQISTNIKGDRRMKGVLLDMPNYLESDKNLLALTK
jgi:hypothetical protein